MTMQQESYAFSSCAIQRGVPMFFNASCAFAWDHGGPITRTFLDGVAQVPGWIKDSVIDTRVHMLMPGWYPAIPGYHHDDVPRPPIEAGRHFALAGQPDYDTPRYFAEHLTGLVNAEIAPTEFALGDCVMPRVEADRKIYNAWHFEVERLLRAKQLRRWSIGSGALVHFDWQTFHTGTRAVRDGWRWFGRISRYTDRVKTRTNEIRRQVQVYLEAPMEGW